MAKEDDIFKDKDNFISDVDEKYIIKNKEFEERIYNVIMSKIIPLIKVDKNGNIEPTNSNMTTFISHLSKHFNNISDDYTKYIVNSFIRDFKVLNNFTNDYFIADKGVKSISQTPSINATMRQLIGLEKNGRIKKGGWLTQISEINSVQQTIQDVANRNIIGGNNFEAFINELSTNITTNQEGLGLLNKKYNEVSRDKIVQYDRSISSQYANALGYQAFRYAGGLINDSRQFCCERNRKVFLISETEQWNTKKWQGKNKNYSPLVDFGGYNCRHSAQWLSNAKAMSLRKDLEITEDGILISTKKVKLNACIRRA